MKEAKQSWKKYVGKGKVDMKKEAVIFLAEGFEEVEALAVVDVLRRAGAVVHYGISQAKYVAGSHQICVQADEMFGEKDYEEADVVILPGMPRTLHLKAHEGVRSVVKRAAKERFGCNLYAPTVRIWELLEGRGNLLSGDGKRHVQGCLLGGRGSTVGKHHYRKRAGHCRLILR